MTSPNIPPQSYAIPPEQFRVAPDPKGGFSPLQIFIQGLRKQGREVTTEDIGSPNQFCFTEDANIWRKIPAVARPTVIFPSSGYTPSSSTLLSPGDPGRGGVAGVYYPMIRGVGLLATPGDWWIKVPLVGSSAVTQCWTMIDCGTIEAAQVLYQLVLANITGNEVNFDSVAISETLIAQAVRAALTAQDSTAGTGSQNLPLQTRGNAGGQTQATQRLLVDALLRGFNAINGAYQPLYSSSDISGAGGDHLLVAEGRKTGYWASLRGRRYVVKTANLTGVAAATALSLTAPTLLIDTPAGKNAVLRRVRVSMPLKGTSTTFRLLVKTDNINRYSSGGTTLTAQQMNQGNAIAGTMAKLSQAPTAAAESAAQDILAKSGAVADGAVIEHDFEDAEIVTKTGSALFYVVTATAGATVDIEVEYEEVSVE